MNVPFSITDHKQAEKEAVGQRYLHRPGAGTGRFFRQIHSELDCRPSFVLGLTPSGSLPRIGPEECRSQVNVLLLKNSTQIEATHQ